MNDFQLDIYEIIDQYGGSATRPTICMELYDSETTKRTTVFDALKKMENLGIIERISVRSGDRGRPKIEWSIIEVV